MLKGKKTWLTLVLALLAALMGVQGCALRQDVRQGIDDLLDTLEELGRMEETAEAAKFDLSLSRRSARQLLLPKIWEV